MARRGNPAVRAGLTALIVLVVVGVGWAFFLATQQRPGASKAGQTSAAGTGGTGATDQTRPPEQAATTVPEAGASDAEPAAQPAGVSLEGLHAQAFGAWGAAAMGELAPDGAVRQRLEFSPLGAGISSLKLGRYFESIKREANVEVQSAAAEGGFTLTPLAALGVQINGTVVNLLAPDVWRPVEGKQGAFEAVVVNGADEPVARVVREYTLTPDSYDITLRQRIENLSGRAITAKWYQYGAVDLPNDATSVTTKKAGRDLRRLRFGYLLKPSSDPTRKLVFATNFLWPRQKAMGKPVKSTGLYQEVVQVWPNPVGEESGYTLAWAGLTNRYFGVVTHGLVGADAPSAAMGWVERIDRVVLHDTVQVNGANVYRPVMGLKLESVPLEIAPGGAADVGMGVYAGPLEEGAIRADAEAARAGVAEIVVYNSGGPCAFCTFPFLTDTLLWLLETVHGLVGDWAIAIIVLVVIVRTILHPVTKWSQIRMQRFAKQMQDMAPKQKKLQERYGNDRQKLQQEVAKLWREEGVNPAGMLGCLPMFLQTPVWIALYATLYYAFELRQQPAFYGVFQAITSGGWAFMADLAEPDHAIWFGKGYHIPVLSDLMGPLTGLNILPLIWAVVFWVHQKYLTPPTTGAMTPEQEQQQKIIKVMSVVMLPVFMYNAPSGLLVYFLTNSVLAIVENHWIRKHVKAHDLLNPEKYRKKRNQPGFMQRLQMLAEAQQKNRQQGGARPGGRNPGGRGPTNPRGGRR